MLRCPQYQDQYSMSRRDKVNNLPTVPVDCQNMGDIIHPDAFKKYSYDPYQY